MLCGVSVGSSTRPVLWESVLPQYHKEPSGASKRPTSKKALISCGATFPGGAAAPRESPEGSNRDANKNTRTGAKTPARMASLNTAPRLVPLAWPLSSAREAPDSMLRVNTRGSSKLQSAGSQNCIPRRAKRAQWAGTGPGRADCKSAIQQIANLRYSTGRVIRPSRRAGAWRRAKRLGRWSRNLRAPFP
jgi:hypothetical protein